LKHEYIKAVREGRETFMWQGQEVLTRYGYYLLLHLGETGLPQLPKKESPEPTSPEERTST